MNLPHCNNSLFELIDGDAFGLYDEELSALKSLFSAGYIDVVAFLLNTDEDNVSFA